MPLDVMSAFQTVAAAASSKDFVLEEEVVLPSDNLGVGTSSAVQCGEAKGDRNKSILKVSSMLFVFLVVNH